MSPTLVPRASLLALIYAMLVVAPPFCPDEREEGNQSRRIEEGKEKGALAGATK
jgi:hypothetical protein